MKCTLFPKFEIGQIVKVYTKQGYTRFCEVLEDRNEKGEYVLYNLDSFEWVKKFKAHENDLELLNVYCSKK